MKGVITKRHFFMVLRNFGWRKAFKLITSKDGVALMVLMT